MHILVTRPDPDAQPLITALEASGHQVSHIPLLNIKFINSVAIPDHKYQAVLITSANGARALENSSNNIDLTNTKAITVGPASAQAASQAGFTNIVQTKLGDVEGIIDYVNSHLTPNDGPLLYPSGTKTTGDLQLVLTKAGFKVERAIMYKAQRLEKLDAQTIDLLQSGQINSVLLFSPRTAKIWLSLTNGCIDKSRLAKLGHFCLSHNVANVLVNALGNDCDITICKKPDTQNMLASINASNL